MKILHTSDWHLGRTLHGTDLSVHHAEFVDHLVTLARDRGVDVVLISGDVFDRAVPPVDMVRLLSAALSRLAETCTVIVTPGNHDSAVRLGFAAGLLRRGVHLLTSLDGLDVPILLDDDDGPVAFYGVPYLDPDTVRRSIAPDVELARSHAAVLGAALDRIRVDLATRSGARSVVLAHAFVVGGEPSESERDIRIGGVDSVPSSVFDGIDYVALGHLHGAQRIGRDTVRYSGSPLAFSFGERHQVKSSTLVTLTATGAEIELIPAPVPRRLCEIRGELAEVLSAGYAASVDDWVRVIATDPVHPPELYRRVRERFPHALVIQHVPSHVLAIDVPEAITVQSDPVEVSAQFVDYVTNGAASDLERDVLERAWNLLRAADVEAGA